MGSITQDYNGSRPEKEEESHKSYFSRTTLIKFINDLKGEEKELELLGKSIFGENWDSIIKEKLKTFEESKNKDPFEHI